MGDVLLTPGQVSELLGVSEATLKLWRERLERGRKGEHGPVFYRLAGKIRYSLSDVEAWLKNRKVRG